MSWAVRRITASSILERQRGESNPAWTPVAASGLSPCPCPGCSPERCQPHGSHRRSVHVEDNDPLSRCRSAGCGGRATAAGSRPLGGPASPTLQLAESTHPSSPAVGGLPPSVRRGRRQGQGDRRLRRSLQQDPGCPRQVVVGLAVAKTASQLDASAVPGAGRQCAPSGQGPSALLRSFASLCAPTASPRRSAGPATAVSRAPTHRRGASIASPRSLPPRPRTRQEPGRQVIVVQCALGAVLRLQVPPERVEQRVRWDRLSHAPESSAVISCSSVMRCTESAQRMKVTSVSTGQVGYGGPGRT
jgi:hypothetical protein